MKEDWKVFIRGVKGRGDEVIKTLESRGTKNYQLDGADPKCLYFINHEGSISLALLDSEFGKIIMDNYHELHLPEKWQDGDVLYIPESEAFVVFQCYVYMDDIGRNHFFTYISVDENNLYIKDTKPFTGNPRLATPSEVEHFHELLHVHGKEWDAEKKQLVDWRWKPKKEEDYWAVILDTTIIKLDFTWLGSVTDEIRYKLGNCFCTREEAEVAVERVKKALKGE